jgi:hypothetical protein
VTRWKLIAVGGAVAVAIGFAVSDIHRHERDRTEEPSQVETTQRIATPPPASTAVTETAKPDTNQDASRQSVATRSTARAARSKGTAEGEEKAEGEERVGEANAEGADEEKTANEGAKAAQGTKRDTKEEAEAEPARVISSNPMSPPMLGAGPFITEAPPWAASAWTSNPEAGAGPFLTAAPPYAASAWTSNPNAGAGPFTTVRDFDPVSNAATLLGILRLTTP